MLSIDPDLADRIQRAFAERGEVAALAVLRAAFPALDEAALLPVLQALVRPPGPPVPPRELPVTTRRRGRKRPF